MKLFLPQGRGTPISYCNATDLGHFGAPFLLPGRLAMFETRVNMFETFPRMTTSPYATDWGFETLFETCCIDKPR